jgi:tripartite-type tricarboxylate transporter receptor subunit TctC
MWYGLFAPRETPPGIVARLNHELHEILDSDEAREAFGRQGLTPAPSSSLELAMLVQRDRDRWADVIARRGITAD